MSPTPMEIDWLRHIAGEDVPGLIYGAAMWACIEYLEGSGYVYCTWTSEGGVYKLTERGKQFLEEWRAGSK